MAWDIIYTLAAIKWGRLCSFGCWIQTQILCIPSVSTVPHSNQVQSLWDCNCWNEGLEFSINASSKLRLLWFLRPIYDLPVWTMVLRGIPLHRFLCFFPYWMFIIVFCELTDSIKFVALWKWITQIILTDMVTETDTILPYELWFWEVSHYTVCVCVLLSLLNINNCVLQTDWQYKVCCSAETNNTNNQDRHGYGKQIWFSHKYQSFERYPITVFLRFFPHWTLIIVFCELIDSIKSAAL